MSTETFPYSHKVAGDRVGDRDQKHHLEADEATRQRIAAAYDLDGLESLTADLVLKPRGKSGVRVVGTLKADIRQICVVSLEPFVHHMEDEIDRSYTPASSKPRRPRDLNEEGEIEIDLETLDPPDVMLDGIIDLGALVCEQLALNIDPFPRKPGVEFQDAAPDLGEGADDGEAAPSPFAALEKLKDTSRH